jgi:preprotein translocase subunit SecD
MKKILLVLVSLLPILARAELIEIRKVVEPGQGAKVMELVRKTGDGEQKEQLTLSDEVIIGITDVKAARAMEEGSAVMVMVTLTEEGGKRLSEATKEVENLKPEKKPRFAIVIDGKVVSAPVAQTQLSTSFGIVGLGDMEEAEVFAKKVNAAAAAK